jgi:uncharacterized protein YndB with AHSA1/START domain
VYAALVDPALVAQWRFPTEMTCTVHEFDARPGGVVHISLTYDDPGRAGKSVGHTDTYRGTFTELVVGERVVEVDEFVTDDPALQGPMTSTIVLVDSGNGTELRAVHEGVPDVVPPEQNQLGWEQALDRLAALVE